MNPSICHNNLVWLLTFPLARGGRDVGTAQLEQNKCGCQDERVLITILLRTEAGEPRGRGAREGASLPRPPGEPARWAVSLGRAGLAVSTHGR